MKQFRTLRILSLAAALAAGGVATLSIQAQTNVPPSDFVLFGGASNPGGLAGYINVSEVAGASEFYPAFLPAAANVPNNIGITLYEDASETVASDQLWVQNGYWYFASDPSLVNFSTLGITQVGALVEDGTLQDVSSYFGLPGPGPGGTLGIAIQSDVEVPEPSVLALAALGLFAFGNFRPNRKA